MNCRSIAEKGPTTEEKVMAIEASLATYEAKISGLGKISRRTSLSTRLCTVKVQYSAVQLLKKAKDEKVQVISIQIDCTFASDARLRK
jgi:hypothetical protein